ncbi:Bug family tripartite tricarboxylate transporter substrate binding protein [Bordetella genomosp. 4]|uniref:ABC transporter substrate-binding protein n=1 Tax=Bordetella genomosp. 4 TaxID=463044 RepID=A0A261TP08_9BORD|nr:tripartite tricarboxylate transporter substrate binding protein [Bordetella genomosp. 4]OZI50760.1 hypothetical protein CAL20_23325 [Bordetella genomosp. 4]
MNERRKFLSVTMAMVASAGMRPVWAASSYPDRPIRLMVPYAPGGGSDVLARVVARALTERLGVSVVVENRGGAGGAMGLETVVRSQPDGYSLVLLSTSHASNGAVMRLNYDVVKDTSAVGLIASGPWLLVTGKDTGFTRLEDLLREAKQNPGSLNYASSGTGSSTHLATELFARKAGISVSHVPYRSSGLALTDLLANRVQFMLASAASVTSYVRDGRLQALCVSTESRSRLLPNIPTAQEAGVPGFSATLWHGLAAPAGTPEAVISLLNTHLSQALQAPTLRDQFAREGLEPKPSTSQEFAEMVATEVEVWREAVTTAGIKPG